MRALLKNGKTVEIDTSFLFENQYNTMDGARIFDAQIARIYDDARVGMGKCRYCGKLLKRGEEEAHFAERESHTCDGCFWHQNKMLTCDHSKPIVKETIGDDGARIVEETKTVVTTYQKYCAYGKYAGKADCNYKECRAYGIEWFTPENTFFLRFPNGFEPIPAKDMNADEFIMFDNGTRWYYKNKIGSYHLNIELDHGGIRYYSISNCRVHYNFRRVGGTWFLYDYTFGWRSAKTLDKVPANVIEKVLQIMAEVEADHE